MMKNGFLLLALVLATLICSHKAEAAREVLSMEQREKALAELEEKRQQRFEKIATIEDEDLVEALEAEENLLYRNARALINFDAEPLRYSYVEPFRASFIGPLGQPASGNRFKRVQDYTSPEALLDAYRSNFAGTSDSPQGQSFRIREPFAFPFDSKLQLTQVVMDDGEVKRLPDLLNWEARTPEIHYDPDEFIFVAERTEGDAKPVKVLGEIEAELPMDVIQFEFNATDVGTTQTLRGYSVTLLKTDKFTYDIEIKVPDDQAMPLRDQDVVGEAVSPHERELHRRMSTWFRADYEEKMSQWLDDAIERAMRGEVDGDTVNQEGYDLFLELTVATDTTLHKAFSFEGPVDVARITILPRAEADKKITHSLEIPVHFTGRSDISGELDIDALAEIDLQGPVYDQRVEARVDLTSEEMQKLIDIRYDQRRPYHPDLGHTEQLHLYYPPVQSSLFIKRSDRFQFDELKEPHRKILSLMVDFFDSEGEMIKQTRDRDELFRFTERGFDYTPQHMPVWPARVRAVILALTAPNIVKQNHRADSLPEGMRLDGNRLTVDYELFTPEEMLESSRTESRLRNHFFAKDAEANYLQPLRDVIVLEREAGEPVHVFYFYGQPESIEVWYRGETELVDYRLDTELREEPETPARHR